MKRRVFFALALICVVSVGSVLIYSPAQMPEWMIAVWTLAVLVAWRVLLPVCQDVR